MSAAFNIIYTTAGLAALHNAQQDGFAPVRIARVGLSPTAIPGSTDAMKALISLPAEARRLNAIGGALASPALIHVTVTDDSSDTYLVRSIGIYTDTDVLLAVYTQAEVVVEKASASILLFALDVPLLDAVAPGTVIVGDVGFSVPPATRVLKGVVELATPEEVEAGEDDERAVTPAQLRAEMRRQLWPLRFLAFSH